MKTMEEAERYCESLKANGIDATTFDVAFVDMRPDVGGGVWHLYHGVASFTSGNDIVTLRGWDDDNEVLITTHMSRVVMWHEITS